MFSLDTSESVEEEQAGRLLIEEASARVKTLLARPALPNPQPGSRLARVDLKTPLLPMSYHLKNFDMVAIDNLRAVSLYIEKAHDFPQMALHSMIRSAVEATSTGLWLLHGGSDEKRAFNCLRLTYEYNESVVSLANAFGDTTSTGSGIRQRVMELQQNLSQYRSRNLSGHVTTTDIVAVADKVVGARKYFSGLKVWKACSGLAHGNGLLLPILLEHKSTGQSDDVGLELHLTTRLTFLGGFFITAIENLERLDFLYREQCQAPNHGKN